MDPQILITGIYVGRTNKDDKYIFSYKPKLNENDEMNLLAVDFIVRSVGNLMIPLVLDTKTAYDAWNKIKNYCALKNASEIRRIRK